MSGEIVCEVKSVIGAALERLAREAESLDKISQDSDRRRYWKSDQSKAQDVEAIRRDCAEQIRQQQEAYENRRLSRRLRRLFFG